MTSTEQAATGSPIDMAAILPRLPFFTSLRLRVVSAEAGAVIVEMPFDPRFATPPDLFPAGIVGIVGDVAAVASCFSRLPAGMAAATIDFTI